MNNQPLTCEENRYFFVFVPVLTPENIFWETLAGPIIILILFQVISAAIFRAVEPSWDLWTAFWYVTVTATTVGYGNWLAEWLGFQNISELLYILWICTGLDPSEIPLTLVQVAIF